MNPPIYEGAAGLSSYESVNGLGQYVPMSGLGVVTPTDACPPITSTFLPPGVVNHDSNGKQICGKTDANAALCNTTADPLSCYFSREYKTNFKNRQLPGEEAIWRAWSPAGSGKPILGDFTKGIKGAQASGSAGPTPGVSPDPAASDDTMLYVGLGVGALVLIGGAVWYKKKKKMAANRRSWRH